MAHSGTRRNERCRQSIATRAGQRPAAATGRSSRDNWDAFADVLWGMLAGIAEDRVALVWTDADALAGSDLQTLITASIILSNTVEDVIGTEHGFPHAMIFRTLLFGNGDMYRSFKLEK